MIMDKRNEFGSAVALNTGAAGTYIYGDVIDTNNDTINDVDDVYLVINVTTAVTSAGSATVQFQLVSDSTANLATAPTVHWASAAIPKATLVAGYNVAKVELPKGTYQRYLGVQQVTGTAALTAGAVSAFLTNDPYTWKSFPDASN